MTAGVPERTDRSRSPDDGDGGGTKACRACSASMAADALRCDRCGALQVESKCPHCGASAGVHEDPALRLVCDVCGAPRGPVLEKPWKSSGRELSGLRRAQAARRGRTGWRAAAAASGSLLFFSAATIGLIAAIFGMGLAFGVVALGVTGALLALTLWAAGKARTRGKEIEPALDAAWIAIATDIAQQTKGTLTAADLARALTVDEARAEQLLALLDVNDVVKSEITEDGEIAYSTRLRVEDLERAREDRSAGAEAEPPARAGDTELAEAEAELEACSAAPRRWR
ncbi:MAG: zinc ribbon domain-containing protein [Polyangiaceae bacterium]